MADTPASFSSFLTPPAWRDLESIPAACMQAWGRSFMTASRFSFAPFGEPGTVIMSVLFRTPATGRDIIATKIYQYIIPKVFLKLTRCDSKRCGKHAVSIYHVSLGTRPIQGRHTLDPAHVSVTEVQLPSPYVSYNIMASYVVRPIRNPQQTYLWCPVSP